MERKTEQWSVADLRELVGLVSFPEYQREPNLWSRTEKQRLIDSMVRQFDIASLYLYQHDEDAIDCVDGRQRIGAIMSFLGKNPTDKDNGFPYRLLNEIEDESVSENEFGACAGLTFVEMVDSPLPAARRFVEQFERYRMSVVMLTQSRAANEFNLQFTRLNLGTIINSGEKLNAMVGDLREECFSKHGLGAHRFLKSLGIPTRRYAAEQLAAQIVAQIFSKEANGAYTRTRHYDLQRLFKDHTVMTKEEEALVVRVSGVLDLLDGAFDQAALLRSRAMAVSTVLLAWELDIDSVDSAGDVVEFVEQMQTRIVWQVGKGLDVSPDYRYLVDFQRDITQASVEKPAVERRSVVMMEQCRLWRDSKRLRGDEEWEMRNPGMVLAEEQRKDIKQRRMKRT